MRFFLIFFVFLFCYKAQADTVTDLEYRRLLVGTWQGTSISGPVIVEGRSTLRQDGSLFVEAKVMRNGSFLSYVFVEGRWEVEGGALVEVIVKSTDERLAPIGTVTRDKILSVGEKDAYYEDESGKQKFRTRADR